MAVDAYQLSFFAAAALSGYLTVRVIIPPNRTPADRAWRNDGLWFASSTAFVNLAIAVCASLAAYHAALTVSPPDTLARLCPFDVAGQRNPGLFTWTPVTAAAFLAVLVGAPLRLGAYSGLGENFTFGLAKPSGLVTDGVYAYVQHPSYTGLALVAAASLAVFLRLDGAAACVIPPQHWALVQAWSTAFYAGLALLIVQQMALRVTQEEAMLKELFVSFLQPNSHMSVDCPICNKPVKSSEINNHIDSGCVSFVVDKESPPPTDSNGTAASSLPGASQQQQQQQQQQPPPTQKRSASSFFSTPASKRQHNGDGKLVTPVPLIGKKRGFEEGPGASDASISAPLPRVSELNEVPPLNGAASIPEAAPPAAATTTTTTSPENGKLVKRTKLSKAAPLAERMRPTTLDDVCGQDLVGRSGVLRSLIESDRVPSMILWGGAGTGKTTIARCIAQVTGSRFVEINATSSSVGECKKLFLEAANDLALTGRKTIIFCDEIHRFNKAQQDVFLRPVEAGTVTLIGATTENPSFKVVHALLSRCRTFTLQTLTTDDVTAILRRARDAEVAAGAYPPTELVDDEMLGYLARFSDGDARTALNLLELALSLTVRDGMTKDEMKASLTKTLVYDRAGDQHYDTISAFHKSVRGGDADAALYYLARMLQSGEDPLFVARRMVVIASEDVGLADNTLLPLATATYTATQQIGMPEARIPLAHCAVALCLAPKSTRAYRALNNAYTALREPGVAALPVPLHLRNAPTRLMRDLGYGAEYKYPPNYRDGRVSQTYLPEELLGRRFLEDRDLGTEVDPDVVMKDDNGKA
ncbi:hypothetical protein PWT90_04970 [Aphanocladium album]|nr:hypothetical protein PWT90_04970 [Aphanocladium album]